MFDPMITNSDYEAEACHRVAWTADELMSPLLNILYYAMFRNTWMTVT